MIASLIALNLADVSRSITSLIILLYLTALLSWLIWQVLRLGKRLGSNGAKLFALLTSIQAILIALSTLASVFSEQDPLAPITEPLPIGTAA
jgi:glucan phosphoethanolaminetransferase (alkaline phosphatase superfamily)